MLEEIKKICNDCLIHHINRKGAECDTNYILWLASAIVYQKAKLEALPRGGGEINGKGESGSFGKTSAAIIN